MIIQCKFCEKSFNRKPSQIKRSKNHFCSQSCAAQYNNKTPKKKLTNKCKQCKSLIRSNLKYCNKECKQQYKIDHQPSHKTCYYCKISKPISNFYNTQKRIMSFCKKCSKHYSKIRLQILKLKCLEYKGNKCIKCGYNKCPASLDFHHRDPNEKDFSISKIRITSWENNKIKLTNELDKCDLLCKNCHAELHYSQEAFSEIESDQNHYH